MKWSKNVSAEERQTRAFVGGLLIISAFFSVGKWIAIAIGALFLISSKWGYCATNALFKKLNEDKIKKDNK